MNRIKELRKDRGLSQAELADKVGAAKQSISYYELGTRKPKEPMWQALANFFNVSVPYLKGIDDKTVIKKFSSEDLFQELVDRKVIEPINVGLYKKMNWNIKIGMNLLIFIMCFFYTNNKKLLNRKEGGKQ